MLGIAVSAVVISVQGVDQQADDAPYTESDPVFCAQSCDQIEVDYDTQDGDCRPSVLDRSGR